MKVIWEKALPDDPIFVGPSYFSVGEVKKLTGRSLQKPQPSADSGSPEAAPSLPRKRSSDRSSKG